MANISGRIMQLSPSIFTWKLRSESRKDVCASESIYICENKYEFYFRLFKIRDDFYTLHLINPQIVFVKLDMHIAVNFYNVKLGPTLENYEVTSFDHFIFGITDANEISEITFTFSNARALKKPGFETGKFYNMSHTSGKLVQISPVAFTWKLESENKMNVKSSGNIQICGNKYKFYFRLCKIREDFYTLHLLNPQIAFVKLDMHIAVKFCDKTIKRVKENYEVKSFDQFILDISHAKDILEILFTFPNVEDLKNSSQETTKLIYKMLNLPGNIQKTTSSKFTWKLYSESSKNVSTSETYVCGNKYEFYFRLFKMREDFYTLHILNPEIDFVKLDMHIVVKFQEISIVYTLENYEVKSFDQFILGISHAKIILEITFTFSNIQGFKKPVCVRGEPNVPDESKVNEDSKAFAAGLHGCVILSADLKNAFLSEEDSDVILRVGDQQYPAHKVIIRNRSSVFRAMLKHDMTEKKEGIVDIEDCDPYIFRDFLLYLYSGKLDNISNEKVLELYYISDKYDVNQLKLDCVDCIVNNLNTDIICDVISLAIKHSEHDLLKHSIEFFMENAEDIFITVQWQKFLIENPVQANELIIKSFKSDSRKQKPVGQKHK